MNKLNQIVIENFRDSYTNSALYGKFKLGNESYKHSSISSSLDWLTYGVELYNGIDFQKKEWEVSGAFNEVFNLILAVDIIQINIVSIFKLLEIKIDINDCFTETRMTNEKMLKKLIKTDVNDFVLFKRIRAIFGFHNNDIYSNNSGEKIRYYSSWPNNDSTICKLDWQVLLYNDKNNDFDQFDIKINEIIKFVEKIYEIIKNTNFLEQE